jgi:hypothetical protein
MNYSLHAYINSCPLNTKGSILSLNFFTITTQNSYLKSHIWLNSRCKKYIWRHIWLIPYCHKFLMEKNSNNLLHFVQLSQNKLSVEWFRSNLQFEFPFKSFLKNRSEPKWEIRRNVKIIHPEVFELSTLFKNKVFKSFFYNLQNRKCFVLSQSQHFWSQHAMDYLPHSQKRWVKFVLAQWCPTIFSI